MLCETCRDIFENLVVENGAEGEKKESVPFRHHETALHLRQSAIEHCQICLAIWRRSFVERPEDEMEEGLLSGVTMEIKAVVEFSGTSTRTTANGLGLRLWTKLDRTPFRYSLYRNDMTELFFSKAWAEKCRKRGLVETNYQPIIYKARTESSGSEECVELAQKWIGRCIRYHSCSVRGQMDSDQNDWYPTRLLDVQDEDKKGFIRLAFHCSKTPLTGGYVTLSHRWKAETPKYLSKENLDRDICIKSLPLSFQEAISLTQRLGYRYLWIDTMCILQTGPGSAEDWNFESSLMSSVYARGKVNIVANGNLGTGIYQQRSYIDLDTSEIKIPGALCENLDPDTESGIFSLVSGGWIDSVDRGPLMARGWVYQERILSPRLLHFCDMQIFWECNELRACELHPNGLPISFQQQKAHIPGLDEILPFDTRRPRLEQHMGRGFIEYSFLKPYDMWFDMIEAYTECDLTFDSDILVAFSGVAARYSLFLDDKNVYLAGIWSQSLPWGLLWRVNHSLKYQHPPPAESYRELRTKYYAPSWSWASTNNPIGVTKHRLFQRPCVTVNLDKTFCTLLSCDGMSTGVFGAVSDGILTLEGRLTLAKSNQKGELRLDGPDRDAVLVWSTDNFTKEPPETVLCLPIIEQSPETPERMRHPGMPHSVTGITLQEGNSEAGVFQRTGWFFQKDGKDTLWPQIPPLQTIKII